MRHALDTPGARRRSLIPAVKALALLAGAWGLAYPTLLWGLQRVMG